MFYRITNNRRGPVQLAIRTQDEKGTQVIVLPFKKTINLPEEKYSEPKNYWYNPDTLVVYDLDLLYPIGKVSVDDEQIPRKLDSNTYIIDKVIPIPLLWISYFKI